MALISIIIPYYNDNLLYFEKCINSILSQDFKDIEIIIVDDGSKQSNHDAVKNIAGKDDRISVIRQENQGVSQARNTGTAAATGEYIIYVDADDMLADGFLIEAFDIAKKNNADIVYGFSCRKADEKYKPNVPCNLYMEEAKEEWLIDSTLGNVYNEDDRSFGRGPWARFLRSDIAKAISFPVGIPLGEDVLWNLSVIKKTTRRFLVHKTWYMYMIRPDSVTLQYKPNIDEMIGPFYDKLTSDWNIFRYRKCFYQHIYIDLDRYQYRSRFGNDANHDSFFTKWKQFNKVCTKAPWKYIREKEYWRQVGEKDRKSVLLFRIGLLFPYLELKRTKARVARLRAMNIAGKKRDNN